MALAAWVLPTPGSPKMSTLSPRSTNAPVAISRILEHKGRGRRASSKVSRVFPGGSFEARRRQSTRRW